MTTNGFEVRQHLEERLTQYGREMLGPGSIYAAPAFDAVDQFLAESLIISS